MAVAGFLLLGPATSWAQEAPKEMLALVEIDVARDGSVAAVRPDEKLPAGLRTALEKRISQWHYVPAQWDGKPVAIGITTTLRLQPVPTTSGGYAIRILGFSTEAPPGVQMTPPVFPRAAMRAGVNAVLVYRVHVAEDGRMSVVGREYPRAVGGHLKALDEVSREAIAGYRRPPNKVDGVAIACDTRQVMTFSVSGAPSEPEPAEPLENQCPSVKLETEIEGTML